MASKRRLRKKEDRPEKEEVQYLSPDEIIEIVNVAKVQKDFLLPKYIDIINEIFRCKEGIDYIGRYVNLVSSLIYSSDNLIFDIEFDDEIEDESLLNLGEKVKKKLEKDFYSLGLDYVFYLCARIGELLGSVGLFLSPRERGRVKAEIIYPWDLYFYYPQLDFEDPSQVIVRIIRMGLKEAINRFGEDIVSQAERPVEFTKIALPSELDERLLAKAEDIINREYGVEKEEISFEEFYDQLFDYLRYVIWGQGRFSGELVNIYEVWYKESGKGYVCQAVVIGNKVIEHTVSPYDLENYPFSWYVSEPLLGFNSIGLGTGDKALRIQRAIRKLLDKLDEATDRFIRPSILIAVPLGSLDTDKIIGELTTPGGAVVITSPDLKVEEYIPKVNLEAIYALIEKKENQLREIIGLSDLLLGSNITGVRSASHAQLISMFASSHLKQKALKFEKFIEEIMTLWGRYLTKYNERFSILYYTPFRVEVYAHTSSPIMALNYMEVMQTLIDAEIISRDILIDLIPVPMKQKLKLEVKKKEEMEKVIMLSEIAEKAKKGKR